MNEHGPLGRVAVIAGGLSHERDLSLRSGRRLVGALRDVQVDAGLYDLDSALLARIGRDEVEVAYPTVHGEMGEDGTIQTLLELSGIPFVGSSSKACRLAWEKPTARVLMERWGIAVPVWRELSHSAFRDLGAASLLSVLSDRLSPPLVVKPSHGGSVLGVSRVTEIGQLGTALVNSFAYAETAVIENFVEGVDVSVAVVDVDGEPRALPAVSLHYKQEDQFDYAARHTAGMVRVEFPADLPRDTAAELAHEAVLAHSSLGLRDVSRSDFIVDGSGGHVLLETAVAPGLSETCLFPIACNAAGSTFGEIARQLVLSALARSQPS